MTFLQPLLLAGLPLIALPIIIHLINQRRYQTVRWGAMMFLLAANRMSRGYARIRQWLIMAMRMAAVAGLIFAVSRPLASGWLGLTAGGRPDTTIIVLDRSPSMQQAGAGGNGSKLQTARRQLANTLGQLGSARWVLIESTGNKPIELQSPDALLQAPEAEASSAPSDVPAMLQTAHDYIQSNKSGRTEIWICSDIRENDWNAESGRWQTLRDAFLEFSQGVRFHLLAYAQPAHGNLALRVTEARRLATSDGADLLLSLRVVREGEGPPRETVPVQFEIDGARSEMTVELDNGEFEVKEHRIPIQRSRERGWGRVSIPADENPADNEFYFVFDQPVARKTVVVADDPQSAGPLQLAAAISPDPSMPSKVEVVTLEQLSGIEWEQVALLIWQSALPTNETANAIEAFVDRGGQVVFFPPAGAVGGSLFGVQWQDWVQAPDDVPVETWRFDQDLLQNTQSGAALPVGKLEVRRYCRLEGEVTHLATLRGGAPLLARATTNRGGVYFCASTPAPSDSSLASGGVVLYVFIQRALAAGASVLGNTRQLVAGESKEGDITDWQRLAGVEEALSTEAESQRGVYLSGERLLAVNRPAAEDRAAVLDDHRVGQLFKGLDFARVDDQAGSLASLIQEIWRLFLAAMMVALIAEALLCLPKPAPPTGGAA